MSRRVYENAGLKDQHAPSEKQMAEFATDSARWFKIGLGCVKSGNPE
jgi:hypothetical protein